MRIAAPFRLARSPAFRAVHSGRVLRYAADKAADKTADKTADKVPKAPQPATGDKPVPSTDGPAGTAKAQEKDDEKIEYFGNTRFPKPRAKPRRTITPGDAVGQAQPAVREARVPLRQQAEQKWRDVLSPEKNLESRARIIHDIGHSYFQDIVDLRNNGDKLFEAPAQLISAKRARYLPSLEGQTLAGKATDLIELCRGKTSLLTVEFTKFGEKHTQSFTQVFDKAFEGRSDVQVVQANIEENWAKALVLKMCLPYLRRTIPKSRHENYLVHYGDVESLRKALGIANPLIGYVFLVDASTRIRWYANGVAVKSEALTMVTLAEKLANTVKGKQEVSEVDQ
ncbi:Mitochondrial ATPase complex subunit atp10 [Coemansia sp. RSA 552]|nr:Mitochondrial ATPase complex subunit atp10 [Coemansia sp. RSA 552]